MYEFLISFVRVGVPTMLSRLISTDLIEMLLYITFYPDCRFSYLLTHYIKHFELKKNIYIILPLGRSVTPRK